MNSLRPLGLMMLITMMAACVTEEDDGLGENANSLSEDTVAAVAMEEDLEDLELQDLPDLAPLREDPPQTAPGGISKAPATGVQYFQVYAVESNQGGLEYVAPFQTSTWDHGGNVNIYVLQYGYGNGGATFSGGPLIDSDSFPLCGTLQTLHYCNPGETITGFMYGYAYSGVQYGNFTTYTNSVAYPFGYWSDQIYVN